MEYHRLCIIFFDGRAQLRHHLHQVLAIYLPITIFVKSSEHLDQFLLHGVLVHQFFDHKANKFLKIHLTIIVGINLADHLVDLLLSYLLLQSLLHHGHHLRALNLAIRVKVEDVKDLLVVSEIFLATLHEHFLLTLIEDLTEYVGSFFEVFGLAPRLLVLRILRHIYPA